MLDWSVIFIPWSGVKSDVSQSRVQYFDGNGESINRCNSTVPVPSTSALSPTPSGCLLPPFPPYSEAYRFSDDLKGASNPASRIFPCPCWACPKSTRHHSTADRRGKCSYHGLGTALLSFLLQVQYLAAIGSCTGVLTRLIRSKDFWNHDALGEGHLGVAHDIQVRTARVLLTHATAFRKRISFSCGRNSVHAHEILSWWCLGRDFER